MKPKQFIRVSQLIKRSLSGVLVQRCNVFVLLPILFILISGYSITCFGKIIYFDGFENGFKSWNTGLYKGDDFCSGCDHALTVGTIADGYPVNTGKYSFRSLVQAGDPGVKGHTARAELSGDKARLENDQPMDLFYTDRWYGFSVYVPKREPGHVYRGMGKILQFHSNNYTLNNGIDLCLQNVGGIPQWVAEGNNPGWTRYFNADASNDIGKWTNFVLQINWGKSSSYRGKFKVWKNGDLVWNADPWYDRVPETGDRPRYLKMGVDYPGATDDYPLIQYYDNFVVGDENSSLEEMHEAMGGGTLPPPPIEPPAPIEGALEAESAILSGITKVSDNSASGGYYVATQSWGTGELAFHVDITDSGLYKIVGRVFAADVTKNSYFFHIDDQEEDIWDFIGPFNSWQLLDISKRGTGTPDIPLVNPYTFQLSGGPHTIHLRGREVDSRLDYIMLERIGDAAISYPTGFKVIE